LVVVLLGLLQVLTLEYWLVGAGGTDAL
jgi:hypothetical protein